MDSNDRSNNDKNITYYVGVPKSVFDDISSYIRLLKGNVFMSYIRYSLTIAVSCMFMYFLFFSGSNGLNSSQGQPQYYMAQEKLNWVVVRGESLKAENVPDSPVVEGKIIFIGINGVISQGNQAFSDEMAQLELASKESNLKAVILDINSPGGTVVGSEILRGEILRLKKNGTKVVALYDGLAASGACYMSVDSDYIIATRSSMVGSIGVIFEWFNLKGLMDQHGVKMEVIKSGPYKDIVSYARDPSSEERKILQSMIDETFNRFVEIVMGGRHLTREEVLRFANGSIFTPAQALGYRFIDQVSDNGKRDAVLKAMELTGVNKPTVLRAKHAPQGLADLFSSKFGSAKPDIQEKITDMVTQAPTLKYEWQPLGN